MASNICSVKNKSRSPGAQVANLHERESAKKGVLSIKFI